ncbi:hypothetical protein [sulfur-oxidizing endosymbiont of Gigantopelta aegis]|uniref:hypothetical protein n=1 Tax=sulfur-oxidizing endosymbiont of Gigantopelta aegis TaxID=2794934 RepID=UPI0018DB48C1|nr:hypothetical protein [sulfur-oxidizing endosymbiont of Gigantopelta aegis]
MKVILLLVVSGISNGSNTEFSHQMEKIYTSPDVCVQTSIIMRKVLRAQDNLQARQTDVYAHCEVSRDGLNEQEYADAKNKIRRLEKYYTTSKW